MYNTFFDRQNYDEENLIFKGITELLLLLEKIFNGDSKEDFKCSYSNHVLKYSDFKKRPFALHNIEDFMKNETITPFKLDASENELTAAIQIIAEVIAGRDFSCEFDKYTITDIRALQDALGKLWTVGNYNGSNQKVISFR